MAFSQQIMISIVSAPQKTLGSVDDQLPSMAEVAETLAFRAGFNTNTVIAGTTFLGLAAGIVGVFALLRKRSLMADALSHATLPGIGLMFLVASALGFESRSLPLLLLGAAISGVTGVLCIQAIKHWTRLQEDAAIGIVLSVFFGAGVVVLSYIQSNAPNNASGLNHFIYGQTAAMSTGDAMLMGIVAVIAVVASIIFMKEFTLVCFNEAFASVNGWRVSVIDLIMMALVVLVTVSGLQAVGLILVVAMLIIPAVSARFWTERLWMLLLLAGLIGAISGYIGSVVSALLPRKPAGAVIVLTSGCLFVLSMLLAPRRGAISLTLRHLRMRLRIAGEHILEAGYETQLDRTDEAVLSSSNLAKLRAERGWSVLLALIVMRWLRLKGFVVSRAAGVGLTPSGIQEGARISRNHRLWEQYLITHADIAPSHVDWSVDQVEHVLPEHIVTELERQLASDGVHVPVAHGGQTLGGATDD